MLAGGRGDRRQHHRLAVGRVGVDRQDLHGVNVVGDRRDRGPVRLLDLGEHLRAAGVMPAPLIPPAVSNNATSARNPGSTAANSRSTVRPVRWRRYCARQLALVRSC